MSTLDQIGSPTNHDKYRGTNHLPSPSMWRYAGKVCPWSSENTTGPRYGSNRMTVFYPPPVAVLTQGFRAHTVW